MSPAKGDLEDGGKGQGQGLLGLVSSLAHLTLHPDSPKDLAKLEANLAKVTINEAPKEEDHDKNEEEEDKDEKDVKEREAEKSETEEEEEEKEAKEVKKEKEETADVKKEEEAEKELLKDSQEKDEDKEKEEEEEKEEENDTDGIVKTEEKKAPSITKEEVKEEEKEKEKDEDKKKEAEEDVSDDENPADEETEPQGKKDKLRSRGLLPGTGHGYSPSSHLDYQGFQQQQQQQHMQMQHSPLGSQYVGLSSPQYGQVADYAGATPTHTSAAGEMWYSEGQINTDYGTGTGLFPSLAESSPASICSSGDGDSPGMQWGGYASLDSPQQQYQDISSTSYPSGQAQGSPYSHYQPSPGCQYQPSPPYYPDNALPQGIQSPAYQDVGYQKGGYQENAFLDAGYQESPFSANASPPYIHATPITPPISPPLAEPEVNVRGNNREVEDIIEAVTSAMQDDYPGMPTDENRIIEITRTLMDMKKLKNLRDDLDQEKYKEYYSACARMTDEELVEADADGDNKIMLAACQGQEGEGYGEMLVALTERLEKINLCCDMLVDWRVGHCQLCGKADRQEFYSPLSWRNNHGEMLLSNVVTMMYPLPVVQYLTSKVMQRSTDLQRTFRQHYTLFHNYQHLYPCLGEPLKMLDPM